MTEKESRELVSDVKDIKAALLGEGTHKGNGIIDRIQRVEIKIRYHERLIYISVGGGGVIVFIINLLV